MTLHPVFYCVRARGMVEAARREEDSALAAPGRYTVEADATRAALCWLAAVEGVLKACGAGVIQPS